MVLRKIDKKTKIQIIKKQIKRLTGNNFHEEYIREFYIPILEKIKNKKKIMITGPQGSGKSTLSELIRLSLLSIYEKKVVIISLDDFYLKKSERLQLAKDNHSLLKVRGVPGTHDIQLLTKIINNLELKKFPVFLPRFNKFKDDREHKLKKINEVDLIIFEGWCVGADPINKYYLEKNINFLESEQDSKKIWRNYYNNSLKKNYQKIFLRFKYKIFFQIPSFEYVYNWRLKQEVKLFKDKPKPSKLKIRKFIQYFEKLTMWMIKVMPRKSNILIKLDNNQIIQKVVYK